jgi:hypothetical protein
MRRLVRKLLTSVAALGTIAGTIDLAGFPAQTPVEQNLQDTGVWAQMGVAGLADTVLVYVGIICTRRSSAG